jgi:hypothetical protein
MSEVPDDKLDQIAAQLVLLALIGRLIASVVLLRLLAFMAKATTIALIASPLRVRIISKAG